MADGALTCRRGGGRTTSCVLSHSRARPAENSSHLVTINHLRISMMWLVRRLCTCSLTSMVWGEVKGLALINQGIGSR
ncbi:hypothetical protein NliqN6_5113 [Naganishia liquefaciens]|uniref:Uncharacterized protein n=1 Tax=Naganishia liquefaciens TaxID=104408 RepID=A0A8H3TW71_9TREE|nr:hypothetical protein NliqN6_5113 [Naganishia liquefaciens]